MIKSITGGSGITVMGGMPTTTYISPGAQSAGMLRYSPNSGNIEVYDGIAWLTLPEYKNQTSQEHECRY